jgi:hypothetical protein
MRERAGERAVGAGSGEKSAKLRESARIMSADQACSLRVGEVPYEFQAGSTLAMLMNLE